MSEYNRRDFFSSSNPGDSGDPGEPDPGEPDPGKPDPGNPASGDPEKPKDLGWRIPLAAVRFLPATFGVPERSFAYIALRCFNWDPSKFVQDYGPLTLKEILKDFEMHFVRGGFSRGLTRNIFSRMHDVLEQPPAWNRSSGNLRPLGEYQLNEFFTCHPKEDVQSWCWPAAALIENARKNAALSDPLFEARWNELLPELVESLKPRIYPPLTPADIVNSTWMALQIARDTSVSWNLKNFHQIAMNIYKAEPKDRWVQLFDGATCDVGGPNPSHRRIPAYVKVALLKTLLDSTQLYHEVIVFLYKFLTGQKPSKIVQTVKHLSLFELISDSFARFLRKTTIPEPIVRELFAQFDSLLMLPFRDITSNERHLNSHPLLLDRQVGWTCLKDYFKGTTAAQQASEIGHWWQATRDYLRQQAYEDGTPLFRALRRWQNEGGDYILTPGQNDSDEEQESDLDADLAVRADFSQRQHKPQKARKLPKTEEKEKTPRKMPGKTARKAPGDASGKANSNKPSSSKGKKAKAKAKSRKPKNRD